jgi:spermidine synthase
VWVYLRHKRYTAATLSYDLAYFSAAFAAATFLSLILQLTLALTITFSLTAMLAWVLLAVCLAAPYFFSGAAVSLALTRSPFPVGRVYGVDLVGAAVGCLGVLALLNLTDGPSAVIWAAALAGLGAWMFGGSSLGGAPTPAPPLAKLLARRGALLAALVLLALANGLTSHGLQPILVKDRIERRSAGLLEAWNSFSRVTVTVDSFKDAPQIWGPSPKLPPGLLVDKKYLEIDGFASTTMYRFGGQPGEADFLKYDVTNLAYFLPGRNRVAVVGVGGGRDVLSAWVFGCRDITGIEINPVFIRLLTQDPRFNDYAGLARLPGVRLEVDEARSWFARTPQTFDLVQMTLTDTEAATGAGAFTLSENGLYTVEAWKMFFSRLTPKGVLTVSRWYAPGQVNETGRVISLAAGALMELGAAEPQRHLFVAASQNIATLIASRSPFAPEDIAALEGAAREYQYQVLLSPTQPPGSAVLKDICQSRSLSELARRVAGCRLDLMPPTDDRPFFFNQLPFYKPLEVLELALIKHPGGVMQGNLMAAFTLLLILLVSLALVLLTIVLPLRTAVRQVSRRLIWGGTAYFMLIGLGFMAVEIGLLQRLSVFLGHPIYSLSVVLFSLILTTGLGSLLSDRLPLNTPGKLALWSGLAGAYIISLPLWLPPILLGYDSAGLLARCSLCVAVITPAGLLMGFGFPTGMRLASAVDPTPTPWFWGINGAAGVLAAGATVGLSIAFGISWAMALGGLCYLMLYPAARLIGFSK